MFRKLSTLLSDELSKSFFACLTTSMYADGIENDDSFGALKWFSGHDMVGVKNPPDRLQKSFLASIASRSASEKSATPPSSCKESILAHCHGPPLASPEVEGIPSRVEAIDSFVA